MALTISEISTPDELKAWDTFVIRHPEGSFAQLSGWAHLKQAFDWQPHLVVVWDDGRVVGGALLMDRPGLFGKTVSYVPYGPLVELDNEAVATLLLEALAREARQSVVLRLEPHERIRDAQGWMQAVLTQQGFERVEKYLQPEATLLLDLEQSEDELMAGMRQTTRRYIRQAERAGLEIEVDVSGERLADFYAMLQQVNQRRQFGVHTLEYYQTAWKSLGGGNATEQAGDKVSQPIQPYLFLVQHDGEALGAYFVVRAGHKSWELYGGVNEAGMKVKANYWLKWQSILAMKRAGVIAYDQWGIAPHRVQEADSGSRDVERSYDKGHHLAGVTYFKEGFGGLRVEYVGSYDKVNQPLFYNLAKLGRKL